jgi:hypothetical protein
MKIVINDKEKSALEMLHNWHCQSAKSDIVLGQPTPKPAATLQSVKAKTMGDKKWVTEFTFRINHNGK